MEWIIMIIHAILIGTTLGFIVVLIGLTGYPLTPKRFIQTIKNFKSIIGDK